MFTQRRTPSLPPPLSLLKTPIRITLIEIGGEGGEDRGWGWGERDLGRSTKTKARRRRRLINYSHLAAKVHNGLRVRAVCTIRARAFSARRFWLMRPSVRAAAALSLSARRAARRPRNAHNGRAGAGAAGNALNQYFLRGVRG